MTSVLQLGFRDVFQRCRSRHCGSLLQGFRHPGVNVAVGDLCQRVVQQCCALPAGVADETIKADLRIDEDAKHQPPNCRKNSNPALQTMTEKGLSLPFVRILLG